MTEEEWLTPDDEVEVPTEMLDALEELFPPRRMKTTKAGRDRKLRLFASAAVDHIRHLLHPEPLAEMVRVSDLYADGEAAKRQLAAAQKRALAVVYPAGKPEPGGGYVKSAVSWLGYAEFAEWVGAFVDDIYGATANDPDNNEEEGEYQRALLRDIFGNPFRPVTFPKKWRTEHTVGIAAKVYGERDFAAMPILADALEEAGCDNQDILTHCREPGAHVRGCWVVDLVLGKS